MTRQSSGELRREDAKACLHVECLSENRGDAPCWEEAACHTLAVIARLDRAIQYSATGVLESRGRGVLDAPLLRGMTAELSARTSAPHATDAFTFTGCTARNAIAILFQALMAPISIVRFTVSASENCARTCS